MPALIGSLTQPGYWKPAVTVTDSVGTSVSTSLNIGVSRLRLLDGFIPAPAGQFIRVIPRISGGTPPYHIALSTTTFLPLGIQFNPQTNEFYGTAAIPHGFGVSIDISDSAPNVLRVVLGFGPTSGVNTNLSFGVLLEAGACGDLNVRTQTNDAVDATVEWGDGGAGTIPIGTMSTHHTYSHDGTFSLRFSVTEKTTGLNYRSGYDVEMRNTGHELCQLDLRLKPHAVYLVHGNTTGQFRLDPRTQQGEYHPLDMSRFTWSSTNPSLVAVDEQGKVSCAGIGEAQVEIVSKEIGLRVQAKTFCGEYGLEPALSQLSPLSGNNSVQLAVQGVMPNGQNIGIEPASVQFSVGPQNKADLVSLSNGGNVAVRRGPTAQSEKVYSLPVLSPPDNTNSML